MLGKYDDYPNGIHEKHIEQADMNGLARIIDIFTAEYVLILEKEKISDVNAVKHISRYRIFADLLTSSLRKWNDNTLTLEEKILQASIYLGSMLEGSLQFFLFAFNTDYDSTEWKKWQTKGVDDCRLYQLRVLTDDKWCIVCGANFDHDNNLINHDFIAEVEATYSDLIIMEQVESVEETDEGIIIHANTILRKYEPDKPFNKYTELEGMLRMDIVIQRGVYPDNMLDEIAEEIK